MKLLQYKSYYGSVEVDEDCLYGKIQFINALINYESDNIQGIKKEFENAVDDYLETCKELNREPEPSCKGSFNVRVGSELHKQALIHAKQEGINLNEFVKKAVEKAVA